MLGDAWAGDYRQHFDGIQRPLRSLAQQAGAYTDRGVDAPPLDETRSYEVEVFVKEGDACRAVKSSRRRRKRP